MVEIWLNMNNIWHHQPACQRLPKIKYHYMQLYALIRHYNPLNYTILINIHCIPLYVWRCEKMHIYIYPIKTPVHSPFNKSNNPPPLSRGATVLAPFPCGRAAPRRPSDRWPSLRPAPPMGHSLRSSWALDLWREFWGAVELSQRQGTPTWNSGIARLYTWFGHLRRKNNISLKQAKMVGQRARNGLNQPKTLDSTNI